MKKLFDGRIDNIRFIANIFILNIVLYLSILMISMLSDPYYSNLSIGFGLFLLLLSSIGIIGSSILIISTFIQRLHDLGRQGREIFLMLIPFYNIYLMYVFALKKGTIGVNEYGINPIDKKNSIAK
jgi:uncharacterized membrane protein YhaH (DUF805 family)